MLTTRQVRLLVKESPAPNRLKSAMRIARVTQEDVSNGTGFTQSTVSRIANSFSERLTVKVAAKFAWFFGCQIEDLFPRETTVGPHRQ